MDAVVVAIDHNKPVIDIKGLLWIKVRFAYYDSKGNPLNVKGYFTLSDLDFKQGFYLADETEHIYLTKEADARIVYDARTEAIWSARRGSEPDGGTTPENSEGWVTFTFEGNSQTMIFYDGGTNDAVTGPGGGVKAPKKWPDNFVNDTSSTYNNWHGASRETGITVVPWNTSEFGYTANVPCHLSKVGDLVVKKMDAETKEAYRYAIQECIEKGILAGYIRKKGSEVINMLIAEYDYEMDIAVQREEAYEEGEKEGCLEALLEILKYKDNIPEKLEEKLKENGMWDLFKEIEMPLVYTLYDMEKAGIKADGEALKQYGEQLSGRIKELETTIYDLAGETFNINSPKQLGVILFEKLQLPYGKKTKTGYSTAADVLEKLAPEAPVVFHILEYRQLAKLKSTYADGLAGYIAADGRIHSKFHQTITATGRISSTEPNLQNIPIRMELGRMIRKVFIPEDGFVFVDADYSQIELRVLAHISGDERLIEAYREAQDIHRITASQVFHVPFDEVTPLQRRNAKAVNFGIVYGISSFGLSQDLSISRKEAAEYIEKYFETYPKIKGFLDGLVKDGKEHGYVTTMFGRRRPVPELKSSNFMQRSFGERVAMNSPIQGTAADIIKIAMNHVYERMKKEGLRSRLVLQVHDELLIETKKEEIEEVSRILEEEMKGAADLAVELDVDMHQGDSWYEAK